MKSSLAAKKMMFVHIIRQTIDLRMETLGIYPEFIELSPYLFELMTSDGENHVYGLPIKMIQSEKPNDFTITVI